MVVMTCNLGGMVESGDAGATSAEVDSLAGDAGNDRTGICSLPTPIGRDVLGFLGESTTTSVGIGSSPECGRKKAGRRNGDRSDRGKFGTCPCELK